MGKTILEKSPLLGVSHLHRLWSRHVGRDGRAGSSDPAEWALDRLVIDGLGLGLRETLAYLLSARPDFESFEAWVLDCHGGTIDPIRIAELNRSVARVLSPEVSARGGLPADFEPVFDESDLRLWEERGYVVVPGAVPPEACRDAEQALWEFLGMDANTPDSWYRDAPLEGIMVPLVRHPALEINRRSPRIRNAFAQLWGTGDLQVTSDLGGFNPPERRDWRFRGSDLHWDTSLAPPIPLGLQGILYLTDTPADQGAFRCVPGFHRRIDSWLAGLPPGTDPRAEILATEATAIAGRAGDLIIWNAALPHGASPNRGVRPRLAQYIAYYRPGTVDSRAWV